jgi:conjugative transfer ATPase
MGGGKDTKRDPLKSIQVHRQYERPPSFTDLLPWVEYLPEARAFLLEDGASVGALFELTPVGTEARSQDFLEGLREAIQIALSDAIPERDEAPWVLQIYVQDEPDLGELANDISSYSETPAGQFTRSYVDTMAAHLARITKPGGVFIDGAVSGGAWRGQQRRVRATLYRRLAAHEHRRSALEGEAELNEVAAKWTSALAAAGIRVARCTGEAFYQWLLPWFNPAPAGRPPDSRAALALAPYPGDEALPFGADFAEHLTLSMPRSDNESGTWWFDDLPHTVVSIQSLRRAPEVGHLTAERAMGEHIHALFDRIPEGSILSLTVTIASQDGVRGQLAQVRHAAVGDSAEAAMTREDAVRVEREMAQGDKLYPVSLAFYIRGADLRALRERVNQLQALLLPNGLQPIGQESDLLRLDSYLRNLPMAYDPGLDRVRRRSRLMFASHLAALVPFYGRARGTGHPGMVFFNRGAEPLTFDPLNRADRKKNAHLLILGPTGSGKSALLVYLLLQMAAMHRPRIFIIEAGGSFALLGEHFRRQGLSVNALTLNPQEDVSLPPFAEALRLLDRGSERVPQGDAEFPEDDETDDGDRRDLLGEMEIAARIMITGGDDREDARMSRADRLLIRNGILNAARSARAAGHEQVLTEDVVAALNALGRDLELPDHRRHRAMEMADGMALFCSGLAGHFFNRPGQYWPEVDVTLLEMGILAREGYEDQLTVAYLSILSHINDCVERHQRDARPTLVVTDEGHLITSNPMLARYVVKITKMWRKLGAWFWIATQNLEDFPDASRRMLNMMEWWFCLVSPKEEVDQIARFRDLTSEQRQMLLSTRKEPGKYVEGVVLADTIEALFRSVPPPLALALAMTEKHEKAARASLMREYGCTDLEAAYRMADALAAGAQATP